MPDESDAPVPLGAVLARQAAAHPHTVALRCEGKAISYGELDVRADRIARALIGEEIGAGSRVVLLGRNRDTAFELLFGCARSGMVLTPLIWRLAAPELAAIIRDCEARLLFVADDQFDRLAELVGLLPDGVCIVTIGGEVDGHVVFDDWLDGACDSTILPAVDAGDTVLQLYTSGTTGAPKGVMLSHAALLALHFSPDRQDMEWIFWDGDDVALVAFPLGHIAGIGYGLGGLANGATLVIHPEFSVPGTLAAVRDHHLTRMFLVPAAIQMLLASPDVAKQDYSSLRHIAYGASPIAPSVLTEATRIFGCEFSQHYGATETCGTICSLGPLDHDPRGNERMRSCGRPAPGVGLRVRDPESGEVLPAGIMGEIELRSPSLMSGYWNMPEETRAAFTSDGWYHTGDAGVLDADGYLYILDRFKDVICSGAENVYPTEVENAIAAHPAVAEVAVFGVPDKRWGEAVKAVVALRPGQAATGEDIIAFTRARIAAYKLPKSVEFLDMLPRNASGKVLRRELREPYWLGHERRVG